MTDQELLKQLSDPITRHSAFGLLVSLYKQRLYWHIRKIVIAHSDADDVLQNVFIKIYQNIEQFKGDSQLFTWMYKIATNESLSFLKSQSRRHFRTIDNLQSILVNNLKADVYFEGNDIQIKLQQAIARLPQKQKLIFNMRYFDEIKFKDMSEILGTSEGALKASYNIAMKKIEKYMTSN